MDLDGSDPLAAYVDVFVPMEDGLIYFAGNSLGRVPIRTEEAARRFVAEGWAARLVRGWDEGWLDLPLTVGDRIGRAVLGAAPGQVVVCDSTTINIARLAQAALRARPGVIVTDRANFPTDRFVLDSLGSVRYQDVGTGGFDGAALISFSAVDYRTGAIADVAAITDAAHSAGALVLWDMSHAAGAIPVDLDAWGVDLAVGCTYKYLCAGPGAPAWLYVRSGLALDNPIPGWFGAADQFAMGPAYVPAQGIRRWLTGTPNILGAVCVDASISLIEEAGIGAIRAKGERLTAHARAIAADAGFEVISPEPCGSHLALRHPDARQRVDVGLTRGVVADFREPDVIRIGLAPLSTRFADVDEGLRALTASG